MKKVCKKCGVLKGEDEFYKAKHCRDGLHGSCKSCMKKDVGRYRDENKEIIAKKKKKDYDKNRDVILRQKREYSVKNKDIIAVRNSRWRTANKESESELKKKYYRDNREAILKAKKDYHTQNKDRLCCRASKQRASRLKRSPAWADKWIIGQYYIMASKLSIIHDEVFHVDHIVPLQGEFVSGLHTHNNLQIITASENQAKRNKFVPQIGVM